MTTTPRELDRVEAVRLLESSGIGRVAFCGGDGPEIYPVNYSVDAQAIYFRTTAYSRLGSAIDGKAVAFEVDHLNWASRTGWSVVVRGRAQVVDDPAEIDRLRELRHEPQPWAPGMRRLYVRIPWSEVSGREVGDEWLGSSRPPG